MKIRVFEAFAGYGSQSMALDRLAKENPDFDYIPVGFSEIENNAIRAYQAIHGSDIPNFGDITKVDWSIVPDFDLLTYSFPCQDISVAGQQRGLTEGTGSRSSLLWECRRAIEQKRPKYLLMENVKALTQTKFRPDFLRWIDLLKDFGYTSHWDVLNAKDYGVPQSRERLFVVSVLHEDDTPPHCRFTFPQGFPLERRLKHIIEPKVAEWYYLKPHRLKHIIEHCERKVAEGCGFRTNFVTAEGISGCIKTKEGDREYDTYFAEPVTDQDERINEMVRSGRVDPAEIIQLANIYPDRENFPNPNRGKVYSVDGIAPTLCATDYKEPKLIMEPVTVMVDDTDRIIQIGNLRPPELWGKFDNPTDSRFYSVEGISPTLLTEKVPLIYQYFRIRRLTEKECFRIMDVADTDIDKIQSLGLSRSAQYKLAGNSIVVSVLYHIFRKLFIDTEPDYGIQLSLF